MKHIAALFLVLLFPLSGWAVPPQSNSAKELAEVSRLLNEGRLDPAESILLTILGRNPRDSDALDLLGRIRIEENRCPEAERLLWSAISANPRAGGAYLNLASCYERSGQTLESRRVIQEGSQREPDNKELGLALGSLYRDADDLGKAQSQFRAVVEKHPRSAEALLSLARVETTLNNDLSAAEHLKRALALAPNAEELLYEYASVSMRLNKPREASQALESAVHMGSESGAYRCLLGLAYLQGGDVAEATAVLQRSDQTEPDRACTFLAFGLALFVQERYAEARTALERSLAFYPGQQQAIYFLARIAQAQGDIDRARVLAGRLSNSEDKSRAMEEEEVYRKSEKESSELNRLMPSLLALAQAKVDEDLK